MPVLSCFTAFGFLEFSSEPSECEKVYRSLLASYRDPVSGKDTFDVSVGTHKEAVIYGWANAIAAARVTVRRAAAELRAETAYCLLTQQEARFGMTPAATDTVVQRRAALAAKQKAARGPRYESVWEALSAILGPALLEYRPITTAEAEAYPRTLQESPGIFRRADTAAKSVRLLTAVTRTNAPFLLQDTYDFANLDSYIGLDGGVTHTGAAQSFTAGSSDVLSAVHVTIFNVNAVKGTAVAKIYAHGGTYGSSSVPVGPPLAVSAPAPVPDTVSVWTETEFQFNGPAFRLTAGTQYVFTIEGVNTGDATFYIGADSSAPAGFGNAASTDGSGVWTPYSTIDLCFSVFCGYTQSVFYENWNRSLVETELVPGDVLCVDPGNLGLVERVTVSAAEGSGASRKFTATFRKPHSAGTYATDGPVPLWTNTKRHVLIVVTAAAAADPELVRRVNDVMRRMMRGPTTWAIVQPSTPGATTAGPFKIGATLGSPLGSVPLETLAL